MREGGIVSSFTFSTLESLVYTVVHNHLWRWIQSTKKRTRNQWALLIQMSHDRWRQVFHGPH